MIGDALAEALVKEKTSVYFEDGVVAGCFSEELMQNESPSAEKVSAVEKRMAALGMRDLERSDLDCLGTPYLWVDDEFRNAVCLATSRIVLADQTSAQNTEVMLMNMVWWFRTVEALGSKAVHYALTQMDIMRDRTRIMLDSFFDVPDSVQVFARRWHESAFARVEVGHKLAAALAFTDAPERVRCPWKAVSITIPQGLFEPFRRLWVVEGDEGDEENRAIVLAAVMADGKTTGTKDNRITEQMNDDRALLLDSYAMGVLLSIQDNQRPSSSHGASGKSKRGRHGPPIVGELYRVGAPIEIDLRPVAKGVWTGVRRGTGPKVQFPVRGHWRDQAYGPRRSLRRPKWIVPYWKGPEESRVLLRKHNMDKETK